MNKLYEENDIQAIADAIRGKNGTQNTYLVAEMADAITSLPTGGDGGITPSGTKIINSNGQHDVTSYATAEVNVPTGIFPEGTKQITSNGEVDVTTFEKVNVNVPTSGGGGMVLPSNTVMGEWTPSENIYDTNPVVIQHTLGKTPKYVVMMMEDISDINVIAMLVVNSYTSQSTVTKAGGVIGYTSGVYLTELTDSSFKAVGKSNTPFLANKKYIWFAFG